MELRRMELSDFCPGRLDDFIRRGRVGRQWRRHEGGRVLEEIPRVPNWSDEKKAWVVSYLAQCVAKVAR